jgi:hypothetical protein
MAGNASDLLVGELIEIKYRVACSPDADGSSQALADRWITAEIIHREDNAPPLARLSDGQITDIRAYMTWRRLPWSGPRAGEPSG